MYIPSHFREENPEALQHYIREYGFGMLIIADDEGIEVNHVPFHLSSSDDNSLLHLQCHLARSNSVWKRLEVAEGVRVLAVFKGPDAYVSPSWYPGKAEHGRVVPTWNYLAVHAEGIAKVVHDQNWLKQHLNNLTNQHESTMPEPWSVSDAPEKFTDRLMQAIVGIEIRIEKLSGKLKASQNQPEGNRAGVKAALSKMDNTDSKEMAKLIR